jgi:threonine synthase
MPLVDIACTNCERVYPSKGLPYRCPVCGGIFDFPKLLPFEPAKVDRAQPGIWRYRHTFGIQAGTEAVSLGEGNTPLLWVEVNGRRVAFKCEFLNPSGSFKDRGSAVIAAMLKEREVDEAVEDSSGNAGASFACYAARAGIRARIFVPSSTSGPKRQQIEAYGAQLVTIQGSRTDVSEAVKKVAESGMTYASHAYLPFNLPGYATAAYEIYEQLGTLPSAVITPAGQGGLLLGLYRGFDSIRQSGIKTPMPKMIGVQARACAPLWAMASVGASGMGLVTEGKTLAEGVRVRLPVRGDAVIRAVQSTQGMFDVVDEQDILRGRDELARRGLYVEPTSAIVWVVLNQLLKDLSDPVVVMLTGSGFKYQG